MGVKAADISLIECDDGLALCMVVLAAIYGKPEERIRQTMDAIAQDKATIPHADLERLRVICKEELRQTAKPDRDFA